jgi:hypothetical protein
MSKTSSKKDLSQQADFVFQGTVKQINAATTADLPVTEQTTVVTVDRVIQAPEHLRDYEGKDITVQLTGRKKVKAGQEAIFFTNPIVWGEEIVVASLGQEAVGKANAGLRSVAATGNPYQTLLSRDRKARLDSSDLVIFGRVIGVSLPPDVDSEEELPSEHSPLWRDAEIAIQEVLKGSNPGKTVTVRFPSSEDRKWNDSPKFHVGQEGYMMLRKQEVKNQRIAGLANKSAEAYTALSPLDVQPPEEGEKIRRLTSG